MRIIRDFSSLPASTLGSVMALGNFDGVHLGHQEILRTCITLAREHGAQASVMTFEPHPREFFSKTQEKLRIYPVRHKIELLRNMGIDTLFLMRFNTQFSSISANDFVTGILHKTLAVRHVITGANFAFGKGRSGGTDFLSEKASELGFGFSPCAHVCDANGVIVSSSAVRAALLAGEIKKAEALLGRPYVIEGRVVSGEQRGRTLGFPTANIMLHHLFKPRYGVYATQLSVEGGQWLTGVASIGVKPTFGQYDPLLEVHLFGRNDELYGKRVRVECVAFIREEKRFDSEEALITQMHDDSAKAQTLLKDEA